jgi:methyltransferase (TIGR00027 family)
VHETRASRTAEYVATTRGLGSLLPRAAQLIDDPWGAEWTGSAGLRRVGSWVPALGAWLSRPAWRWLLYMQVRTHALDEVVRRYAQRGGRQLVLLGAGLDARAIRLKGLGLRVFEVDHPATHERKRAVIGDASTLVAWDFERSPLRDLPARLREVGYVPGDAGCVLWEGVTMYLSEEAIDDSVRMMGDLLAPGSQLAFTYFAPAFLENPSTTTRLVRKLVAHRGEPWRFAWEPSALPGWLKDRGFALESDDQTGELAGRYLPEEFARRVELDHRRIAVARRGASTA